MPIRFASAPPKGVRDLVARELKSIGRARGTGENDYGSGEVAPRGQVLPVYGMSPEALEQGGGVTIENVVRSGWRYVVNVADGVVVVDYIGPDDASQGATIVKRGAPVEHFNRTARFAQQEVGASSQFEARVLDFGHLGMHELWLHNPDASQDKFFSLGTTDPSIKTSDEVMAEAKRRIDQQPRWTDTQSTFADDEGDLGGGGRS